MGGPTYGKNPPSDQIDFGIVTGQHWLSWEDLKYQWDFAEQSGLDSAWAFDHFYSLYNGDMGPCMEGMTILGAMAERTERVQMGLLVTGMTHRNPALLFKEAVTVDQISGGRFILGAGAAWNEPEHNAYGIPFPSPKERVDRFEEAMEAFRLLERRDRTTYEGEHVQLVDAPFEPKPVYGHIPVLIGSRGKRMMRITARYGDQWDGGGPPDEYAAHAQRLDELCRDIGRDPSEIRKVMSSGAHNFEREDVFRNHVKAYHEAGARTFLFDMPLGEVTTTTRNIVEKVIPELREELGGR